MKRSQFTILIMLTSLGLAQAQHKPGSGLLIFNVGFTEASPEDSDNDLHGNTLSLSYEKSDWEGRLAGGVGIQFSNVKYFTENVQVESADSGLLIGGVAGLNVFLNETILLNANYSLNYLSNSFYKDGLAHNINIGLGFQFY
jgi:hypothetical protein